jgi:hypothetical protein
MDEHRRKCSPRPICLSSPLSARSSRLTALQLINSNMFEWSVALIVLNPDSLYYGGYFKAKMTFPKNYPYSPPGTSHPMRHIRAAPALLGITTEGPNMI